MGMTTTVEINPKVTKWEKGNAECLTATLKEPPPGKEVTWRWEVSEGDHTAALDEGAWETVAAADQVTDDDRDVGLYTYKVTATIEGEDQPIQGSVLIEVKDPTQHAPGVVSKVKLVFRTSFATVTAIILLVLLALFVWFGNLFSLAIALGDDVVKADPRAALAAKVIGPVLALGALLLVAGLWMVMLEWRGGFETTTAKDTTLKGLDVVEIVKAVGSLKGATLVFVGGLVVVLAVAWMVGATAGGESNAGATASATASASASASVSATPTR